ncbi:MAG: alanine racemase [Anaerolineaceae bacterium]|nr:alanine racemase [Anaerolineaceae bacterium]
MISLYDILEAANGQLFGEPAAQIFTEFCFDSRLADEAQLYVALKTDRGDTHQYIREAVDKGVLGVLCTHPPEFDTDGLSVILVKDTQAALLAWAHYVIGKLGTQVICVTGSSGKSLAVEAITQVLSTHYPVHKSSDHTAGWLGLPQTLAQLRPEHRFIVLELGTYQAGELANMVQAIQPDVGVITNVGYMHTDNFTDLDEIAHEQQTLVEYLSPTGLAVLNYDDDRVRAMTTAARSRVLTVGLERFGADLMAYNIVQGRSKTGFDLRYGSERFLGRWTPLLGKHQLVSLLAALAVGLHYDVSDLDETLKALTNIPHLPGRMNPMTGLNGCLLIDDSYNASPESTLAALDWLQTAKSDMQTDGPQQGRIFFITGDMDHLGAYTQFGHRLVGQRASEVADVLITEGTSAALAGRAALDQGMDRSRVAMTYSVQDAIAILQHNYQLTANDILVITGGASSRMEMVTQALLQNPQDKERLPRQNFGWDSAILFQSTYPSWVEISLDAIAGNVRAIKQVTGDSVALMAVVKSDAYGHGALSVSRTALLNGAEYLAVSSMHEALELREADIEAPILILGYTPVHAVRQALRHNITLTLYDLEMARAFDRIAREFGNRLRVHVKVDSGMGRLGVLADEAVSFFRHLGNLTYLEIEGIYTHLAMADEDEDYTAHQVQIFKDVLKPLRASGLAFAYVHAANSAGTLASTANHFNMVRVGLALYGLHPSSYVPLTPAFQPAMTWKTSVAQVKTFPKDHPIGYGGTYRTRNEETIAILPVGYADGFRRAPNTWRRVLIHGQFAPVVGRVSMEKTAVNVSHIPNVTIGDEVVLLGQQGDNLLTAEDIANELGTNNYEVVTTIQPRVPRR